MLKNKGARAIGKHPFQHRFWCLDGKSNEAVFISRFSTALYLSLSYYYSYCIMSITITSVFSSRMYNKVLFQ